MGGVAAGSAIAQYLQSEEARKLSARERKELERLLAAVQNPNFDYSKLSPQQYEVVRQYVPEAASFVEEARPDLLSMDTADARVSREAQRAALEKLRAQAQGQDPLADAELEDALARAASANRGRRDAVKEDFSRRGQLGTTQEMVAQLLGTQQANESASEGSRAAFIESQRRKLQALRDSVSVAGAIRDDEFRQEARNDDILNSSNSRTAQRKQSWADGVASTRNEGERFNLTNEQDVSNRNTGTGNTFEVSERDRQDNLKQRTFDNDMSKVRARAGIAEMGRQDAIGAGRDRNNAISGLADGVQTALAFQYDSQQKQQQPASSEDKGFVSASQSISAQPVWQAEDFDEEQADPLKRRFKTNKVNA